MRRALLLLLPALAMSVGWGFRGDYGHEAGAMVAGALVALAACIAAGREAWLRRASLLAFLGALGWSFGGSMSYGRITGYTAHTSFPDVLYGYACLFVIGALWAGTGAGILALGLTRPRSELERFAGPLAAIYIIWLVALFSGVTRRMVRWHDFSDSDWYAAVLALPVAAIYAIVVPRARRACAVIMLLCAGWLVAFFGLRYNFGIPYAFDLSDRFCILMTPVQPGESPRSENWAGAVGLFAALLGYLLYTRNRAAVLFTAYGLLAGGIGFAGLDFINMLGRAQWGPIGQYEALRGLDYWKWMEQGFGLIMGLGVGLAFARIRKHGLAPPDDDEPNGPFRYVAPIALLIAMLWENLFKNVRNWHDHGHIEANLFGLDPGWWFFFVGIGLAAVILLAILRDRRGALALAPASTLGRAQLLFLLILWIAVIGAFMQAFPGMKNKGVLFVHLTFWCTALACTALTLMASTSTHAPTESVPPDDRRWRLGLRHVALWLLVPAFLLSIAWLSTLAHDEPLGGAHLRFNVSED